MCGHAYQHCDDFASSNVGTFRRGVVMLELSPVHHLVASLLQCLTLTIPRACTVTH